jgi:nitrogenase-stabilizing/protective protein
VRGDDVTRTLERLGRLSTVEDFFAFFEIAADPRVVERHRVAILRAWAREVAEIDDATPPEEEGLRLALYRDALRRTHDAFASGRGHLRLVTPRTGCSACALRRR